MSLLKERKKKIKLQLAKTLNCDGKICFGVQITSLPTKTSQTTNKKVNKVTTNK